MELAVIAEELERLRKCSHTGGSCTPCRAEWSLVQLANGQFSVLDVKAWQVGVSVPTKMRLVELVQDLQHFSLQTALGTMVVDVLATTGAAAEEVPKK